LTDGGLAAGFLEPRRRVCPPPPPRKDDGGEKVYLPAEKTERKSLFLVQVHSLTTHEEGSDSSYIRLYRMEGGGDRRRQKNKLCSSTKTRESEREGGGLCFSRGFKGAGTRTRNPFTHPRQKNATHPLKKQIRKGSGSGKIPAQPEKRGGEN